MFGDGSLTFSEFARGEPLPLATIHDAVLEFLRGRGDAVLIGAHAVNAYVDESRMTDDVNILSTQARELAEELRKHLADRFHIAARVRSVADGKGFRIFQLRQPKNRHLVDVRQVSEFPPTQIVAEIRALTPEELIAQKVLSYCSRRGQPKSGTDWRDLAFLLLAHPQLKTPMGAVKERLVAAQASEQVVGQWLAIVASEIRAEDDEAGY
jgi:hypothetical protein